MLTRYVVSHGARLLRQPSTILSVSLMVGAVVTTFLTREGNSCSHGDAPGAYGAFVCYSPVSFLFLLPTVTALVGGGLVASSRARGEDMLYRVRGLSPPKLASGRLIAGSLSAGLCVLVAGLLIIGLALLLLPHRAEPEETSTVIRLTGTYPQAGLPDPTLWRDAPLVNDFVAVALYALAAAALTAVGNAVGQLVAQPLLAFAAPVFLVLGSQVAPLTGNAKWLSGYAYLAFMPTTGPLVSWISGSWRLPILTTYWSVMFLVSMAVIVFVARRQEAQL